MKNPSARLPPGLYALIDDSVRPERSVLDKAAAALEGGAKVLQLRMKATLTRAAIALTRQVVALCERTQAVCLVNDRVDWALLARAHGVHVGEEDVPPADARRLLGPKALVGVTTRNLEDIRRAHQAGADYVGLGPVFASSTKQMAAPPLGLVRLTALVADSPLPVVAIAGIGLSNIAAVAATGVHAAAVASDLLDALDIAAKARELQRAFRAGQDVK
ncbi:MAG: thiamine phosphate synthase [Myxococcota bacterium]